MKRTIDDEGHEAFRASCGVLLERNVVPFVDEHLANVAIARDRGY